jgi:predicted benzoate:H+ symporter BenE
MMLMICGIWFVALSLYLATLRPGFTERQRKSAFWWGMVVLMGLHVLQYALVFTRALDHWVVTGTSMIVIRELGERMPGGSIGVWIVCGLVVFAFYRVTEARFLRVESCPGDDVQMTLIARPIGAAVEDGEYAR